MKPLISIIIPVYKNFNNIYKSLDSIFIQNYPNIEIIISDDGSPDFNEHRNHVETYIKENKRENISNVILNHLEENVGTSKNCNRAIGLSSGKYIKLLPPEDELYDEDTLKKCHAFSEEKEARIVIGQTFVKRRNGDKLDEVKETPLYRWQARSGRMCNVTPPTKDLKYLASLNKEKCNQIIQSRCIISTVSVFFRRDLLEETGGFLEDFRLIEDMTYWPYLASKGETFYFVNFRMVKYALGGVSNDGPLNSEFAKDYATIMKTIYIPSEVRGGIFNKRLRRVRERQVDLYIISRNKINWKIKLKYLDVLVYQFYRNVRYLLIGSKL